MKRVIVAITLLIAIGTLASCADKQSEVTEPDSSTVLSSPDTSASAPLTPKDVLDGKAPFTDEEGRKVMLADHIYGSDGECDYLADVSRYVTADLDGDGESELVADIGGQSGIYLILHREGSDIYGYQVSARAIQEIRQDGTFSGSSGAEDNCFCRMNFDGTSLSTIELASSDGTDGGYRIDKKPCTADEFASYMSEWNKKPLAVWTDIEK